MKKKDFAQFKQKPVIELEREVTTLRERLRGLRFDLVAGKVKNAEEIRELKRSIAQLLTLITMSKQNKQPNT